MWPSFTLSATQVPLEMACGGGGGGAQEGSRAPHEAERGCQMKQAGASGRWAGGSRGACRQVELAAAAPAAAVPGGAPPGAGSQTAATALAAPTWTMDTSAAARYEPRADANNIRAAHVDRMASGACSGVGPGGAGGHGQWTGMRSRSPNMGGWQMLTARATQHRRRLKQL